MKTNLDSSGTKLLLVLLLLFLGIRIVGIFLLAEQGLSDPDSVGFNNYAKAILEDSRWITEPDFVGEGRPPLYPFFIAGIYALFGEDNYVAVYLFQAFISVLVCFYIYRLSRLIFDEKVAQLCLLWSGLYVFYLQFVAILMRETLVFFLLIAFFYYLYMYLVGKIKGGKYLWLSVILFSLLLHTDSRYLFFLPFFLFLFFVYSPIKLGLRKYVVFVSMVILSLVPWTIRNFLAYDAVVLVNTRTFDSRSLRDRDQTFEKRLKFNVFNFGDIAEVNNIFYPLEKEREMVKEGINPKRRTEEELQLIRNDVYPASKFFHRKWVWFKEFWRPVRLSAYYFPFPDARFHGRWSLKHNLSSLLCYGILLPFMLIGFYLLIRKKKRIWIFLAFPIAVQTLLHVVQWARERYRIPIDAFIMIVAFYAVAHLYAALKKRNDIDRVKEFPAS
jgi:hypothetical protein